MANVKVKLKLRGIQSVLKSPPVQADVSRRAARIAQAAGPGFQNVTKPHRFTSRAFVQTTDAESAKAEAEDKALTRALAAAR